MFAALCGIALTSTSVASWGDNGIFVDEGWFTAEWRTWADWYYESTYSAGEDSADPDWHYEGYGWHSKCFARYNITMEIAYDYFFSVEFELGLFDVVPYKSITKWYRPERSFVDMLKD